MKKDWVELSSPQVELAIAKPKPEFRLYVRNLHDKPVAVKVKSNVKRMFTVEPNRVLIAPNRERTFNFVLTQFVSREDQQKLAKCSKFLLEVVELQSGVKYPAEEVERLFTQGAKQKHEVGVVFIGTGLDNSFSPLTEKEEQEDQSNSPPRTQQLKRQYQDLVSRQQQFGKVAFEPQNKENNPSKSRLPLLALVFVLSLLAGLFASRLLGGGQNTTEQQLLS